MIPTKSRPPGAESCAETWSPLRCILVDSFPPIPLRMSIYTHAAARRSDKVEHHILMYSNVLHVPIRPFFSAFCFSGGAGRLQPRARRPGGRVDAFQVAQPRRWGGGGGALPSSQMPAAVSRSAGGGVRNQPGVRMVLAKGQGAAISDLLWA